MNRDLEFWKEYYRGRSNYRGLKKVENFWLDYFDSYGFSKSPGPKNAHLAMTWYIRDGLLIGYYVTYDIIMWELWYENLYIPLSTSDRAKTRKNGKDLSVPELLYVLDCLFIPSSLPLLIGIPWVAPIVSVLLAKEQV